MVDEAVVLLDEMAALTTERVLFSSDDVLNFCLDLRQLLAPAPVEATDEAPIEETPPPSPEPELAGV